LLKQLTRLEQRYTIWDTSSWICYIATEYLTSTPDKTNTSNPSPYAQRTDTELSTADNMQQETRDKSHQHRKRIVSLHLQRRLEPTQNHPFFSSDEESPKNLTESSSKDKETTLINDKSSSDDESEKYEKSSSSTEQEKKTAGRTASSIAFMNATLFEDYRSV
jgi:hypothetical protein